MKKEQKIAKFKKNMAKQKNIEKKIKEKKNKNKIT